MGCTQSRRELSPQLRHTFLGHKFVSAAENFQARQDPTTSNLNLAHCQRTDLHNLYFSDTNFFETRECQNSFRSVEESSGLVSANCNSVSTSSTNCSNVCKVALPRNDSPDSHIYSNPLSSFLDIKEQRRYLPGDELAIARPLWMNNLSRDTTSSNCNSTSSEYLMSNFPVTQNHLNSAANRPSSFPQPLRTNSWQLADNQEALPTSKQTHRASTSYETRATSNSMQHRPLPAPPMGSYEQLQTANWASTPHRRRCESVCETQSSQLVRQQDRLTSSSTAFPYLKGCRPVSLGPTVLPQEASSVLMSQQCSATTPSEFSCMASTSFFLGSSSSSASLTITDSDMDDSCSNFSSERFPSSQEQYFQHLLHNVNVFMQSVITNELNNGIFMNEVSFDLHHWESFSATVFHEDLYAMLHKLR